MRSLLFFIPLVLSFPALAASPLLPLSRAHSHNDYEQRAPLQDALAQGFCSVEADVWLVGTNLLVAHDLKQTKPERTLERLYLQPLGERIRRRQDGSVNAQGPDFYLLIDIKSEGEATYAALQPVLQTYRQWLTRFEPHATRRGAVTVILSGNRPASLLRDPGERLAALDGRLPDLEKPENNQHYIAWISEAWGNHFKWRGQGPMPAPELARLQALVEKAHAQGRQVRFWATPELPEFWGELQKQSVDWIGTDRLPALKGFLLGAPTTQLPHP